MKTRAMIMLVCAVLTFGLAGAVDGLRARTVEKEKAPQEEKKKDQPGNKVDQDAKESGAAGQSTGRKGRKSGGDAKKKSGGDTTRKNRRKGKPGSDPDWRSMPEERRQELRKRFEKFKSLSPGERDDLARRHEELRRLRSRIAESAADELKDLAPEERKKEIDYRVRKELETIRARVEQKEFAPPPPPPPGGEQGGPSRRMRRTIERENIRLAERRLSQMVDEGILTAEEKKRILEMPREKRVEWILERQKEGALRSLEGRAAPEEIERLRKMSPHRFHDEMRRHRREQGLFGEFARLCRLSPEQDAVLKEIEERKTREEKKRHFFDENFRRRLESLGVDAATIERILELPLPLRMRKLHQILREIPPEKIPDDLRPLLPPPEGHPPPGPRRERPGPGMRDRPGPGGRDGFGPGKRNGMGPGKRGGFKPGKRDEGEAPSGDEQRRGRGSRRSAPEGEERPEGGDRSSRS